ncbi:MAG: sugar ABC transporter permease [Caldilineaceae bacterium]
MTSAPAPDSPECAQTTHANTINGLLFASPWLFGLIAFWIYPTVMSAYYSFTKFNGVQGAQWIGLSNYVELFTDDSNFWDAVYNTLYFAGVSIPLAVVLAFTLALMLNAKIKGQVIYRTIYFLPTLVPEVALALVWVYMFTPVSGVVNLPWQMLDRRDLMLADLPPNGARP